MIRRLLLSSYRVGKKNRLYFSINLFGLTMSMIAVMVIVQFIIFETSFDRFHQSPGDIYRVSMELHFSDNISRVSGSYSGIGETMVETFPEVQTQVTTSMDNKEYGFLGVERSGEIQTLRVGGAYYATPDFFKVFDFPIISGNVDEPLSKLNDMVITKGLADRLFADENPIGREVYWYSSDRGRSSFQVSAVVDEVPDNSHFQFEVLIPMELLFNHYPHLHDDKWAAYGFYTYIKLKPGSATENLQSQLEPFITTHLGRSYDDPIHTRLFLQSIKDIHLYSNLIYEPTVNGDISTLRLLAFTTALLVILAYANYVNLFTSIVVTRAREVGVKKVLGSSVRQLMLQFQVETLMINVMAFGLACLFLFLTKDQLPQLFDGYPKFILFQSGYFWITGMLAVVLLSALSGFYPAHVLSSQKSIAMLRGTFSHSRKGVGLRRNMVVFQFMIASGLIVFTLVVNNQFQFMLNQEVGTAIDQVLILKSPLNNAGDFALKYQAFKNDLLNSSVISEAATSSSIPGSLTWGTGGVRRVSDPLEMGKLMTRIHVDETYTKVYDLQLVEGRKFSDDFQGDEGSILLTRKAAQLINAENPESVVGEHLIFYGDTSRVVGLIENYFHHSLKREYQPIGLKLVSDGINFLSLKIASDDLEKVLITVERAWQEHFPNNPFDFFFLDDHFNRSYQKERNLSKIINVFSGLAVIIACLGLFGLSSFMLHQRVKEIGIRKVLGAGISDLFWTMSAHIFRWVLIAYLIAIPFSIYISINWLDSFPNRMTWHWLIPLLPLILMLAFATVSITYNVIRAALLNPVKSLRSE